MHNSKVLFQDFLNQIAPAGDVDELRSISYLVFENIFGLTKTDVLANHPVEVSPTHQERIDLIAERIKAHEPVQYILGEAYFLGRRFDVDKNVLIPRPETEELVLLIKQHLQNIKPQDAARVLDIGTGSGCIPITLALEVAQAKVFAADISKEALNIAKKNAVKLQADVTFIEHDILTEELTVESLDVVVSNPPYITHQEKSLMHPNVLNFEPHLALFVPTEDPLMFYKSIAAKSKRALKQNGMLFVEINQQYGKAVADLFSSYGYADINIYKDTSGKDRIVSGVLR